MGSFDLLLRLFGLVLGLAIAQVLGGLARTLRLRANLSDIAAHELRIGWLVPLLGLLVIMDQTHFWLTFYLFQDHMPANYLTMLGVLLVVGLFYVLSTLIFPEFPALWPDFDVYYFRVRRMVFAGLMAVHVAPVVYLVVVLALNNDHFDTGPAPGPVTIAASLAFLPTLAALMLSKQRAMSTMLLVLANALLVVQAFTRAA